MTNDEAYRKGAEDQQASEAGLFGQNDIPRFANAVLRAAYSRGWNDSAIQCVLARVSAQKSMAA